MRLTEVSYLNAKAARLCGDHDSEFLLRVSDSNGYCCATRLDTPVVRWPVGKVRAVYERGGPPCGTRRRPRRPATAVGAGP
jgi:hypothetical protein